jgi:dTDP-4-amino-4,6-dideoxygalactose transaminase
MKIGRTVPPAAALLCWADLWHGVAGIFSPGRPVLVLEEEIRRHFGVGHVFLVSSGTAALTLTLTALKSLSSRTEVVIPAYTCFSVPAAILKAGLRPVLCDINPSTFDFDHALLERTLSGETLCVVVHHLFGIASDIERIRALCEARGIVVVEDAAQAMGVESNGCALGTLGDVGIFSLGRGKNITCGSGGIVVTKSDRIGEAIGREWRRLESPSVAEGLKDLAQLVLMTIFIRPGLYWIPAALPFLRLGQTIFPKDVTLKRLSGMHAGFFRNWRSRLRQSNRSRSRTATYFSERLSLTLAHGPSHPYLRLPLFAATPKDREWIHSLSEQRGLGLSLAYPTPINEIPEISRMFDGKRFPSARTVAEHILTIPTHHWLSEKDKRAIAECVETSRACTAGKCTNVSSTLPRKPGVGGRAAAAPLP